MITLSLKEARKLAVLSQGLAGFTSKYGVKRSVDEVVQRIGYIQIDTISVIERAHHHKLWTRVDGYHAKYLSQLENEKKVFEYWSHAASYLPITSYRFTLPVKAALSDKEDVWHKKNKKDMAYTLDRITAEGPMMSRDFEQQSKKKISGQVEWGPNKWALFHLFMEGKIMIVKRENFQKVYDLPERWLPDSVDTSMPSRDDYLRFLIRRDLQAHGLMTGTEMGYLLTGVRKDLLRVLFEMEEAGEVERLTVKKKGEYFMPAGGLDLLDAKGYRKKFKILSPFDNLVINRKRTLELFGFDYTLECYVPSKKRKFGYFGLPLLSDDQIVGQIDVKADRKKRQLLVRRAELSKPLKDQESILFTKELNRLREFNGCDEIYFDFKVKDTLGI